MNDAERPTSSSASLRRLIDGFRERADKILSHPLSATGRVNLFGLRAQVDAETRHVLSLALEGRNLPEESWAHLALLERPIVFNENDPISIPKLTRMIEHEHPALRGMLKPLRQERERWKSTVFIGIQDVEQSDSHVPLRGSWLPSDPKLTTKDGSVISVWSGEVGEIPDGLDTSTLVGDWYFADLFFNGCLWHADEDKLEIWQQSSPLTKSHIAKCAELRAVGGVFFVRSLYRFIEDARMDGHDL